MPLIFNLLSFLSPKQLDRALEMQQEILTAQEKQQKVNRPAKMVRDAHQFMESLLGNIEEKAAQAYCLEVTKLGYATLDWINKKSKNRPRVTTAERAEPSTSHSLSFSPLLAQAQERTSQRASWGPRHRRMGNLVPQP